jgi:hypothetical protein
MVPTIAPRPSSTVPDSVPTAFKTPFTSAKLLMPRVPTNPPTPETKLLIAVVKDCVMVAALAVLTAPAAASATPAGRADKTFLRDVTFTDSS